ncbi:hypothetical protein [Brachybacterium paraconglomeratum]|uniref:hypothetical protein n=1 Tax=Brachybacterium paraconglomeratum TaxID=173362 RepID=UPI00223B352A|nr:hypothetical protein [Brachybacterium paraconglomeratum]MCT1438623.1 hypothetical protein [Brachybacterium paraconglomeratum]
MRNKYDHEYVSISEYLAFQTSMRRNLGLNPIERAPISQIRKWISELSSETLEALVDYRLSNSLPYPTYDPEPRGNVAELGTILQSGGSSWTVGNRGGRWGLVEAIPSAVINIAQSLMAPDQKASALLSEAWSYAFGIDKEPSFAYYSAVRAVEVYSCPLISPNDVAATLGKDINVLRNKPTDWKFVLDGEESVERLTSMLRMLWHSQSDRHGSADYRGVDIEQAKAAVLLATTLVGWLSQGHLKRASESR